MLCKMSLCVFMEASGIVTSWGSKAFLEVLLLVFCTSCVFDLVIDIIVLQSTAVPTVKEILLRICYTEEKTCTFCRPCYKPETTSR